MPGPWDKYKTEPESGPWAKYQSDTPVEKPSAMSRFASGLWDTITAPLSAIKKYGIDPTVETVKSIGEGDLKGAATHALDVVNPGARIGADLAQGSVDQARLAAQSAREGEPIQAFGHGLAALLPGVGPAAVHAGERIGEGDVAGGVGEGVGLLAPFGAVEAVRGRVGAPARPNASVPTPPPSTPPVTGKPQIPAAIRLAAKLNPKSAVALKIWDSLPDAMFGEGAEGASPVSASAKDIALRVIRAQEQPNPQFQAPMRPPEVGDATGIPAEAASPQYIPPAVAPIQGGGRAAEVSRRLIAGQNPRTAAPEAPIPDYGEPPPEAVGPAPIVPAPPVRFQENPSAAAKPPIPRVSRSSARPTVTGEEAPVEVNRFRENPSAARRPPVPRVSRVSARPTVEAEADAATEAPPAQQPTLPPAAQSAAEALRDAMRESGTLPEETPLPAQEGESPAPARGISPADQNRKMFEAEARHKKNATVADYLHDKGVTAGNFEKLTMEDINGIYKQLGLKPPGSSSGQPSLTISDLRAKLKQMDKAARKK